MSRTIEKRYEERQADVAAAGAAPTGPRGRPAVPMGVTVTVAVVARMAAAGGKAVARLELGTGCCRIAEAFETRPPGASAGTGLPAAVAALVIVKVVH